MHKRQVATSSDAQLHLWCRRKQKENQEDLLKRVNEETLRQLRHNQDDNNQSGSGSGRQVSEVVAYRSISDMPSVQNLAIQVCAPFISHVSCVSTLLLCMQLCT